jgi:sulfate permease, SulP family
MMLFSGLVVYIPLPSLAAVLVIVAYNMSELHRFRYLMSGPVGDRLVLLSTFVLTVAVDLTVAIEFGVVLAAILFMHRMSKTVAITGAIEGQEIAQARDTTQSLEREALPPGTEVFHVKGPLFFGVASRFSDVLHGIGGEPKTFILRLEDVPLIDATGAAKMSAFAAALKQSGTALILTGLKAQPRLVLRRMGLFRNAPGIRIVSDYERALAMAKSVAPD